MLATLSPIALSYNGEQVLGFLKSKKILVALAIPFICIALYDLFGFGWKVYVPKELKSFVSTKVIYEADGTHFVGPRGINEAFVVFSMSDQTAKSVQEQGLKYLERLSTDYDGFKQSMFKDWQATPVKDNQKKWRVRGGDCKDISLCSFYGDYQSKPKWLEKNKALKHRTLEDMNFVDDIEPEYVELVHTLLRSPNSYFAFGEPGVLIVSPEHRKLFLLFRD